MTTPMLTTEHPTEELLAEYIDDRLDSSTREPVTEHLVSCGECREIVLMSTAFQKELIPVAHGNFGGRRWVAAFAGLAAAAAIAFFVMPQLYGPSVDELVAASEGMSTRVSDGRLAGGFAYSDRPRIDRGEGKSDIDYAKAKLYRLALDADEATWSGPHIRGLSRLLIAQERDDVRHAVAILEIAHEKARGEERDAIAIDLAAALLVRARHAQRPVDDYGRALALSNEVLQRQPKSPEALWNCAVALQSLNRDDAALRAFDDYLKFDPNSEWADEARGRKASIESYR